MQLTCSTFLLAATAIQGVLAHPTLVLRHKHHHNHQQARSTPTVNDASNDANEDVGVTGDTAASAISVVDNVGSNAYTVTFTSDASTTRHMVVWNKVGSDGEPSSGSFVSKAVTTKFDLAPGETKHVAFEPNTQAAFCDWTAQKTTAAGQFDCPMGEVNMAPTQTDGSPGWSAADVSVYAQSPSGDGKGYPCNLDISAERDSSSPNSTCSSNYYYTAAGSGLPNGLGVVVNESNEAHFLTLVSDMGTAS